MLLPTIHKMVATLRHTVELGLQCRPPPPLGELLGGATHNGGVRETLVPPVAGRRPHVLFVLVDDFGWADAGWHRPPGYKDVQTPVMNSMVAQGIELERHRTCVSRMWDI